MSRRSLKDNVIQFGTLHPSGLVDNVKVLKQSDIGKCPHVIFEPSHYRENGSCRCDDPNHTEMGEWGYKWFAAGKRWIA